MEFCLHSAGQGLGSWVSRQRCSQAPAAWNDVKSTPLCYIHLHSDLRQIDQSFQKSCSENHQPWTLPASSIAVFNPFKDLLNLSINNHMSALPRNVGSYMIIYCLYRRIRQLAVQAGSAGPGPGNPHFSKICNRRGLFCYSCGSGACSATGPWSSWCDLTLGTTLANASIIWMKGM